MAGHQKTGTSFDPPNELRCSRHDGKSWRCNHWRIHDQRYCEEHYLKLRGKSLKKKEVLSHTIKDSITGIEFQTRQRSKRRQPKKGLKFDSLGRRVNTLKAGKVNDDQVGGKVDEVLPQKKDTINSNLCGRSSGGGDGDSVNGEGGVRAANEEFFINLNNSKGLNRKREEFESKDEDGIGKICKKMKSVKIGKGDYKSVGEDREIAREVFVYKRRKVKEKQKGETAESNSEDKKGKKDDHLLFDRKARFLERFRRILQLDEEDDDGSASQALRMR